MDFQSWIEGIGGLASLYCFDVLPDGTYSEIKLMAVNKINEGMLHMFPNAPEFYPGIPYRSYWMDLNFESFVYKCAATNEPLYSYVNARGVWLKGFYLPIVDFEGGVPNVVSGGVGAGAAGAVGADVAGGVGVPGSAEVADKKTLYCLYIVSYSDQVETENMAHRPAEVANAVLDIGIRLHETPDFYQSLAGAAGQIREFCGAEMCSLYIVDRNSGECCFINEHGLQEGLPEQIANEMGRTPLDVADAWEEDLALSDCLLLENLEVIRERDPLWYRSMCSHGIKNIILYAIRYKQKMVGYIWAANYDVTKLEQIKETLELSTFLLAAVIDNYQMFSLLEIKSTVDALTRLNNRNAMDEYTAKLTSGEEKLPETMGVVFADLNGLKRVNDEEGHDAGDKLLKRAAALLRLVFGDEQIYRAGGDEFIVFCQNTTEERVEEQVSQLKGMAENTNDVSFAVGSVFCTGAYDINAAIQEADDKMYQDKKNYYLTHPQIDRRKY